MLWKILSHDHPGKELVVVFQSISHGLQLTWHLCSPLSPRVCSVELAMLSNQLRAGAGGKCIYEGMKKLGVLGNRNKEVWLECGNTVGEKLWGGGWEGVRYVTRGQILWGFIGHCKDFMSEEQWRAMRKAIYYGLIFFFLALLLFLPLCRPWVVSGQEWKQSAFLLSPVLRHRPYFCVPQFWFHMIIFLFSGWTWDLERRSGCLTISKT